MGAEEVVWDDRGMGWFYGRLCVRVSAREGAIRFVRGDAKISIFRITLISDDLITEVGAAVNIFFFKNERRLYTNPNPLDQYFYFYQPQ